MRVTADWKEFFALLNARAVEYLIVGGIALAFHGRPRFTGYVDVFVRPARANAESVIACLVAFGLASLDSDFGGEAGWFIDLQTLIRNKRASGRPKDIAALQAVGSG